LGEENCISHLASLESDQDPLRDAYVASR